MFQHRLGAWCAAAVLVTLVAAPSARAQATAPEPAARPVSVGGDVSAIAGRRDADAFFNYTDYDHDGLRILRMRLAADWRISRRFSALGEVQAENGDVDATALYLRWRVTPALVVQAGRIPPVTGAFSRHPYGRDNPLIGAPLAYQYLTSLRPDALPATSSDVLAMRARGWRPAFPIGSPAIRPGVPLVSSRWDTGIEAAWRHDWLELSGAVTAGAPAVPRTGSVSSGPGWSGRAALHLPSGLTVGASGARADWINASTLRLVPADRRQSAQTLAGVDAEFGRGHWLVRGEWLRAGFEVPLAAGLPPVAHLTAASAFVEARYRPRPRWNLAARVERLGFSSLAGPSGPITWDAPVRRVELVAGFRARRTIELRAGWQGDWRDGGRVRARAYPVAQVLVWF